MYHAQLTNKPRSYEKAMHICHSQARRDVIGSITSSTSPAESWLRKSSETAVSAPSIGLVLLAFASVINLMSSVLSTAAQVTTLSPKSYYTRCIFCRFRCRTYTIRGLPLIQLVARLLHSDTADGAFREASI